VHIHLLERDCAWIKEANILFLLGNMAQGNIVFNFMYNLEQMQVNVWCDTKLIHFFFWIYFSKINLGSKDWTSNQIQTQKSINASFFTYCTLLLNSRSVHEDDFRRL